MRTTFLALLLIAIPAFAAVAQTAPAVQPFDSETHPPAPDYALASSWTPQSVFAAGATKSGSAKPVDVFYVNPTTYPGPNWNQDIASQADTARTEGSVMVTQASAFTDCCLIYAPRYRQAAGRAVFTADAMDTDGGKAFNLAYQDVRRAFEYYLQHDNHGRPFILAGHSQGTFHLIRLLQEDIIGKPVQKQMVAAYLIGIGMSEGAFDRNFKGLTICKKPADTGCIVSWNTYIDGSDISAYLKRSEARFVDRYGDDPAKKLLCVNPLTFDTAKPDGNEKESLGALTGPAVNGALPVRESGKIRAHCADGILFVDPPVQDAALLKPLPGGSLHMQDVELFYENLRRNALLRVKAWTAKKHG